MKTDEHSLVTFDSQGREWFLYLSLTSYEFEYQCGATLYGTGGVYVSTGSEAVVLMPGMFGPTEGWTGDSLQKAIDAARSWLGAKAKREIKVIMTTIADCVKGRLYRFRGRNFFVGVYDGHMGFVGIRTKFGAHFLDTEFHWDADHFGTVRDIQDTGIDCPPDILLTTDCGTQDRVTKRPMKFDKPANEGGRGWYFTDTGEPGPKAQPCRVGNDPLLAWLSQYENL